MAKLGVALGLLVGAVVFWAVLRSVEDATPGDAGRGGTAASELRVEHDGACPPPCRAESHWRIRLGNGALPGPAELCKRGKLTLRPDDEAPYGLVFKALRACEAAGVWPLATPRFRKAKGFLPKETWIFMKPDPVLGRVLRKIGNRGEAGSDEELLNVARRIVETHGSGVPVILDPTPDTPWKDVAHLRRILDQARLGPVEFQEAPPE